MKISPLDAQIIALLQQDARMPVARIAHQVGQAEATVRRRLNRMVAAGFLQFAAWINPPELPNRVWAQMELSVDMRRVDEVASELAKIDEIYFVSISSGPFPVKITAVFSSNEEMLAFLSGPLASIPGIEAVNTSTVVKLVKRKAMYAAPWMQLGTAETR